MKLQKNVMSFKRLLCMCRIFLRFSGIVSVDPVFDNRKVINVWASVAYFTYYVIGIFTTIFVAICLTRKVIKVASTDLYLALETSNSILAGILIISRGVQLFYFRSEIKYLLGKLKVLWEDKLEFGVEDDIMKIVKGTAIGTKIYASSVVAAAVVWMGPPLGTLFCHFVASDKNVTIDFNNTGILADYPFPTDTITTYTATLIGECFAFIYYCSFCIASDSLLIQLITHVSVQLKILGHNLTTLGKHENVVINERILTEKLDAIGKRHCELISYCHLIKRIYSPVIFFNLLLTALNVCICLKLVHEGFSNGSLAKVAQYLIHWICFILIAIFNCASAQMLINSTEAVATAAYECELQDHQKYFKKSSTLIMAVAQKGYEFNVYGFYKLNMSQLTFIMHTAISYWTLLKRVKAAE